MAAGRDGELVHLHLGTLKSPLIDETSEGAAGRALAQRGARMSDPTVAEHFDVIRGTRIRLQRGGEGSPLLYLVGSAPGAVWSTVQDGLSQRYTVLLPDHPGFGFSDDDDRIDSVHDMAFFYLDVLDELDVDRATVVGASLGGWIAADVATIAPERVSKLVLVGACGIRVQGVHVPDWFLLTAEEQAARLFYAQERKELAVAEAALVPDDPEQLRRILRSRIADAHLGWNPLYHDPKLPNRLHRIKAPTLIIWGRHDEVIPLEIGEAFADLIPHAELRVIEDAGHLPQVEQPDAFRAVIDDFLKP
jgi:pimeloyl-ACP methyl ester carboxylesterase